MTTTLSHSLKCVLSYSWSLSGEEVDPGPFAYELLDFLVPLPSAYLAMDSTILTSGSFTVKNQVQKTEECVGKHILRCLLKKTVTFVMF